MWQWVARGNIQQIRLHSPDSTAFTFRAHAAPSGECNYYVYVCMYAYMCVCECVYQRVGRLSMLGTDSLCKDGADAQYMQYLSKTHITSPQTR